MGGDDHRHIHLLGITDEDSDMAVIQEVDKDIIVTIDSTWPVYMAMYALSGSFLRKKHSWETWNKIARDALDMTDHWATRTFERIQKTIKEWNELRASA